MITAKSEILVHTRIVHRVVYVFFFSFFFVGNQPRRRRRKKKQTFMYLSFLYTTMKPISKKYIVCSADSFPFMLRCDCRAAGKIFRYLKFVHVERNGKCFKYKASQYFYECKWNRERWWHIDIQCKWHAQSSLMCTTHTRIDSYIANRFVSKWMCLCMRASTKEITSKFNCSAANADEGNIAFTIMYFHWISFATSNENLQKTRNKIQK